MKVLFLDFDGVLNNHDWLIAQVEQEAHQGPLVVFPSVDDAYMLDPRLVALVDGLVADVPGLEVVVSSTWRIGRTLLDLQEILGRVGFTHGVYGATKYRLSGDSRGREIDAWLHAHPDVESFCILDDDMDMAPHMDRLVKTSMRTGVTEAHIARCKEILHTPWAHSLP